MNIFKSALKLKRSSSSHSSSNPQTNDLNQIATSSNDRLLNSRNATANQSGSRLNLPIQPSDFDPSVILSSTNIPLDGLPPPDECIHKALQLHEKGELEEATKLLKIAATQNHPLGLFLLGISLRHGWGCDVDTLLAFQCLQHSAESAIIDLNSIQSSSCNVAKHELTIAIHELGICFRHGWGVTRNKETAAYYFELAANLGDADSQNELGHCYLNGEGVKKDRMKAAHYFRLADKQGFGQVGNSWIYKEKYDPKP